MNNIKENSYIYGIKIDNELVYIGKTSRPIKERVKEHIFQAAHNEQLEEAMQNNDYQFVVLYESHNVISDEELCQIEKTLITNLKPKYNILGVTKPYELFCSKPTTDRASTKQNIIQPKGYKTITWQSVTGWMGANPFINDYYIILEGNATVKKLLKAGHQVPKEHYQSVQDTLNQIYGALNECGECTHYTEHGFQMKTQIKCCFLPDGTGVRTLFTEEECTQQPTDIATSYTGRICFTFASENEIKEKLQNLSEMLRKPSELTDDIELFTHYFYQFEAYNEALEKYKETGSKITNWYEAPVAYTDHLTNEQKIVNAGISYIPWLNDFKKKERERIKELCAAGALS